MRALIYIGGGVDPTNIHERPAEGDLTIAADSGWHTAALLGVTPQILLGDFDSIGTEKLPEAEEILQLPPEKDRTDTQLAVSLALSRGAAEIVIIGGLSGRLDHTLSNVSLLEALAERGVRCLLLDGYNRVRYLKNTGELIPKSSYRYLSLLAVDPKIKGVTARGCRYPLDNAKLSRNCQYAVSNEITGNCALVEVRKGAMLVVESV